MSHSINKEKYENTILYICHRLGGSVFGKKKLFKLLYYIDFDNFEYKESMHSITGEKYHAWKMGPVPQNFNEVIRDMEKKGKIKHESMQLDSGLKPTDVYTALVDTNDTSFSDDEKFVINRVMEKYGHLSGRELEILTHAEAPYIATEPNDYIAYELAFYRGTDFHDSVARM